MVILYVVMSLFRTHRCNRDCNELYIRLIYDDGGGKCMLKLWTFQYALDLFGLPGQ